MGFHPTPHSDLKPAFPPHRAAAAAAAVGLTILPLAFFSHALDQCSSSLNMLDECRKSCPSPYPIEPLDPSQRAAEAVEEAVASAATAQLSQFLSFGLLMA